MTHPPGPVRRDLSYALSLPERTLRAAAAGLGGLLYDATQVLLPAWLRRPRLYQAIVAGTLRIAIELVSGATGVLPPDEVTARELAACKRQVNTANSRQSINSLTRSTGNVV